MKRENLDTETGTQGECHADTGVQLLPQAKELAEAGERPRTDCPAPSEGARPAITLLWDCNTLRCSKTPFCGICWSSPRKIIYLLISL